MTVHVFTCSPLNHEALTRQAGCLDQTPLPSPASPKQLLFSTNIASKVMSMKKSPVYMNYDLLIRCMTAPVSVDSQKDILYNLLAMIGQWNSKDINDGWFCRTETSELSLWEPLKNSHWNLFRRLSNTIFKIFCLKPTSNLSKYYRQPISSSPAVFIT